MKNRTRPNILWICTDQQRYDTIHSLGNRLIHTPNLDKLVKQGTTFTRAYTQSPVCTPSRASFLTGRYPRTTRVTCNGNAYFPVDEKLVTRMLADIGYDCGLVGKLHLTTAYGTVEKRIDDGYRFFKYSHAPRNDWKSGHDYQEWLKTEGVQWEKDYKGENGGIEACYHQTTWCFNQAIRFVSEKRDGPWLLSINPYDPHPPFDPPEDYIKRFNIDDIPSPKWLEGELENKPAHQQKDYMLGGQDGQGPACLKMTQMEKKRCIAAYYAMIELIDEQLGRLLDFLDENGQRDNTIIIFHSDHGEMLGDHGLIWKGAYFYEEIVHVPLIISCPDYFLEDMRSNALVELVDIVPTILETLGIDIPYYVQGKSLIPILTGLKDPHEHKQEVYCEFYNSLKLSHKGIYATMYLEDFFKIVMYHTKEEKGELYCLKDDPDEYYNLWDDPDYAAIKMRLMKKCFDKTVLIKDPKPPMVESY